MLYRAILSSLCRLSLISACGISKYLCQLLELSVEDNKREPLDDILRPLETTLNMSSASKTDWTPSLQKDLITKKVLDHPRVHIDIDNSTTSGGGTRSTVASKKRMSVNVKSSDTSDEFSREFKSYLEDQIKKIASTVKQKDQDLKDKTTEMMYDAIEAFKGSITELAAETTGTLKVNIQTLKQRITDEESVRPELIDFVTMGAEITFKVVKKKAFADYWD
ncbi:hypothetical protein BWQ96_08061 [Gracilariopsis chorda]|uniref:Uncharacterized protein n=1 Tax=Gracilariopsis chorda TaxID=448386 RepID=A0A2V3IJL8_9FLOR|nr:hypothetical protein BWQ96_08061 [Gracilariopsis chorda]|eukprot:PXF42233.1 hypothetical protein BWQ96_08061 [Gracilariopsis chorda]